MTVFPFHYRKCPSYLRVLGGPNLFVKRDDLTDLAFGGNKARTLEFIFVDDVKKGADVVVAVLSVLVELAVPNLA